MIACPSCGAQNDDSNRFCDQCGTRLDSPVSTTVADLSSQPTSAAATCPSCGAVVLPGEAFCDSCGAALQNVASAPAPADAPTVFAPAEPAADTNGDPSTGTVTCPMCGHQNTAGDRFCDNCGAALQGDASTTAAVPQPDPAVQTAGDDATALNPPVSETPPDQYVPPMQETAAPTPDASVTPTGAPQSTQRPEASVAAPAAEAPTPQPAAEAPAAAPILEAPAAAPVPPADDPARTRLEDQLAKQRQVVAQLEQTQSVLGSLTPPAIQQALDDARASLAQTESDLDTLPPPRPAVDPAEVARLEDQIAKQRQVVAQLEQTQSVLGSLTPPAIQQALDDARASLASVENELAALTGGAVATDTTAVPASTATSPALTTAAVTNETATSSAQSAPTPAAPPVPSVPPAAVPEAESAVPPAQSAQPVASARPRFVLVEGGAELPLPTDRTEIVVGREDPISQIFPEIDLTPYGGESGGVSRQHARLSHNNGQWTIVDLNSTNYTRVDGARLDPSKPVAIIDGAQIQFGRIAVVFHA